jgi:deoxyribodipyrimidine photo-lyase
VSVAIVLFTRDLRVRDHAALTAATTEHERVVPLFVLDEAVLRGRTGVSIVDAGMRQLHAEGWAHNRARLIVAAFLTKALGLDWRNGARAFAELLVDADVANNVGNWQWVAGTGVDARPNRGFNPLAQARRHDPNGDYVRRYVPELAEIAGAAVHEPGRAPLARVAPEYPAPLGRVA